MFSGEFDVISKHSSATKAGLGFPSDADVISKPNSYQ